MSSGIVRVWGFVGPGRGHHRCADHHSDWSDIRRFYLSNIGAVLGLVQCAVIAERQCERTIRRRIGTVGHCRIEVLHALGNFGSL